ncbi:RNA polymerase sigma factor [Saccharicrinis aurantiacus]|uniref:RNA polymerase sigma factor n=1 Tax=Saccharicrinis aurantiacus TaxID=1849719 RepID=UPI00094FE701|nr:RNA polymerase sigma factor [Saccharicrinis aurantiacus]
MQNNLTIEELIQQNQALIHKVALVYAKSDDEAKDMFQEICIQLYKGYASFKHQSKVSTWIYRVAINTAVSWIRKEKKHSKNDPMPERDCIYDESPFYLEAESAEMISTLYRAINHLSEIDKTLVLLYLEETSYCEISEILGISKVNVRVKMSRVKKTLKKLMQDERLY